MNVSRRWFAKLGLTNLVFVFAIFICVPAFATPSTLLQLNGNSTLSTSANLTELIQKAESVLKTIDSAPVAASGFENLLVSSDATNTSLHYTPTAATGDKYSTSIRFSQTYKGLKVFGDQAIVHFNPDGAIHDITGKPLNINLDVAPTLTQRQAYEVLASRYQRQFQTTKPVELEVLKDFSGRVHLVYYFSIKAQRDFAEHQVFLDAHSGQVVLEYTPRLDMDDLTTLSLAAPENPASDYLTANSTDNGMSANNGFQDIVLDADTPEALSHVDSQGYPTDINLKWYKNAIVNGQGYSDVDRTAINAYRNAIIIYDYYKNTFGRLSYDNKNSPIVSIVHMGEKMNNAFWLDQDKVMCYGDGDGKHLTDLTYGLDVAAHELTHGVTASTAKLVYAGEAGALNESYSDFFGKMVDYTPGNWDIGERIMAPGFHRRALRNMEHPEEFHQPGTNDSFLRVPTTGPCTPQNDECGVHTNSGIPSHAAVLIVQAIGKQKAEQLYYRVLTTRLTPMSDFKDARHQTEQECDMMYGRNSQDCHAVSAAFDAVKIPE